MKGHKFVRFAVPLQPMFVFSIKEQLYTINHASCLALLELIMISKLYTLYEKEC